MELTKQERKFAEISVRRSQNLLFRYSQPIGWLGVILFGLGILKLLPLPEWCHKLFLEGGFFIIVISTLTFSMTIIGKLYEHIQAQERKM